MNKVYLVDGTFELFRAYYANIPGKAPDGTNVGATIGFCRGLIQLIKKQDPCYLAVAFDHVIESFRNDLFEGYKTGEGIEPELWAQFSLAEEAVRAMGIPLWSMVEFEADDALATGAVKYAQDSPKCQIVLCSPDKDLAQVVRGERIVMWDRIRDTTLNEQGVQEKFGVGPSAIADLLALVGDKADGVPGIPKWGMKSASTLLARYGSLGNIPLDEAQWDIKVRGAKGLCENLKAQIEDAKLYKTLTTLRLDVPIKESLDDLKWQGVSGEWQGFKDKIGDHGLSNFA